jgi:hypothetical protein
LKKRLETQRHRGHGGGKKEVEGEIGSGRCGGEKYREGGVRIGFAGFGGRLSSGNSVDSVPLCFKKRGLKHRGTESTERGRKRWRGDGIGLKVARMFGVGNRWWLGLRGNEKRRECD